MSGRPVPLARASRSSRGMPAPPVPTGAVGFDRDQGEP
ncbi:MAG: hypothetical protein AVDCRST_MAG73-1757 [uncultured Thermomicrobiales bacterium]|uniref:Uncharacterized protein n=1 Tax=uncultured Thermomicrobiales bacterium TaxID=1645740 RepID=A0A6J4U341_9BACT|nr:MAG: hypothetical protein AVDCRST_MAG73-1757 [uncultured Thermomicrobiales bacterium]